MDKSNLSVNKDILKNWVTFSGKLLGQSVYRQKSDFT